MKGSLRVLRISCIALALNRTDVCFSNKKDGFWLLASDFLALVEWSFEPDFAGAFFFNSA